MTDYIRRTMLKGAVVATATAAVGAAAAQVSSDQAPKELDGKPMPEPPPVTRMVFPVNFMVFRYVSIGNNVVNGNIAAIFTEQA